MLWRVAKVVFLFVTNCPSALQQAMAGRIFGLRAMTQGVLTL